MNVLPDNLHHAPRGQIRVLSVDRDTGIETVELDCFDELEAREFCQDHSDDRPWVTLYLYDDQGDELDGQR